MTCEVIGAAIGLICSGSDLVHTQGILGASATLTTSAIAFLAGYGVEGVFKPLDALVLHIFKVNWAERPPQAAS